MLSDFISLLSQGLSSTDTESVPEVPNPDKGEDFARIIGRIMLSEDKTEGVDSHEDNSAKTANSNIGFQNEEAQSLPAEQIAFPQLETIIPVDTSDAQSTVANLEKKETAAIIPFPDIYNDISSKSVIDVELAASVVIDETGKINGNNIDESSNISLDEEPVLIALNMIPEIDNGSSLEQGSKQNNEAHKATVNEQPTPESHQAWAQKTATITSAETVIASRLTHVSEDLEKNPVTKGLPVPVKPAAAEKLSSQEESATPQRPVSEDTTHTSQQVAVSGQKPSSAEPLTVQEEPSTSQRPVSHETHTSQQAPASDQKPSSAKGIEAHEIQMTDKNSSEKTVEPRESKPSPTPTNVDKTASAATSYSTTQNSSTITTVDPTLAQASSAESQLSNVLSSTGIMETAAYSETAAIATDSKVPERENVIEILSSAKDPEKAPESSVLSSISEIDEKRDRQPDTHKEEQGSSRNRPHNQTTQIEDTERLNDEKHISISENEPASRTVSSETVEKTFESALNRAERFQEVIERFDEHLLAALNNKDKSITINLIPRNLGKLELICREENGQLFLEIVSENRNVRTLLSGQEEMIKETVENTGLKLSQFDVKSQADGQQQKQYDSDFSSNKGRTESELGQNDDQRPDTRTLASTALTENLLDGENDPSATKANIIDINENKQTSGKWIA